MKSVLYVIHIPMMIVGMCFSTLWAGFKVGFIIATEFWADEK